VIPFPFFSPLVWLVGAERKVMCAKKRRDDDGVRVFIARDQSI
jgi:hypothetical protein